jgi:hypothetical protein
MIKLIQLGCILDPCMDFPSLCRGVYLVLQVEDLFLDCFLVSQAHLSTFLLLFLIGETSYLIA